MVGVNLREEMLELGLWYHEPCSLESRLQLCLVQLSALIAIDALEKLPKLSLRLLNKSAEFWRSTSVGRQRLRSPLGTHQSTVYTHHHLYQRSS
jgi:hypothetical protein